MQLTTPSEPAMAVSTAINTLSNLLQSTFLDMIEIVLGLTKEHKNTRALCTRVLMPERALLHRLA